MTPLAQQLVRDALTGRNPSTARERLLQRAMEWQCFDCTEGAPLVQELSQKEGWNPKDDLQRLFLPAPYTWIEWARLDPKTLQPRGGRTGILLSACDTPPPEHPIPLFRLQRVGHPPGQPYIVTDGVHLALDPDGYVASLAEGDRPWPSQAENNVGAAARSVAAWLAVINTPNIVKQVVHEPHAGLRRELLRAGALTGQQRQRPWVEIRLDVQTPADLPGGGGRLTGPKALHFCRAHLRVRLGKVEWVRSHWRGDASKGVATRDYRVRA